MAQRKQSRDATLLLAMYRIFDKLCAGHRRSYQNPAFCIRADDLRRELFIPEGLFAEALDAFVNAENQMAVEVFERNGERFLQLGESAQENCNGWSPTQTYRLASKPKTATKSPSGNLFPRSA
jgi:hypothetical protein